MGDCQLELLLLHCVSFCLSDLVRLLMYGEGWEFGEIAKWLGGDWHWEAPSSKRKFEGNEWRIDMKPGGKQLLMILWVLQMVTLHYLSSYRKFAGCARVLSFQLKDHQKNQEVIIWGHYQVIHLSISFHIFPTRSNRCHVPGTPAAPRPANGTWRAAASAVSTTACAARRWAEAPSKIRNSKVNNGKPRVVSKWKNVE